MSMFPKKNIHKANVKEALEEFGKEETMGCSTVHFLCILQYEGYYMI